MLEDEYMDANVAANENEVSVGRVNTLRSRSQESDATLLRPLLLNILL